MDCYSCLDICCFYNSNEESCESTRKRRITRFALYYGFEVYLVCLLPALSFFISSSFRICSCVKTFLSSSLRCCFSASNCSFLAARSRDSFFLSVSNLFLYVSFIV